MISILLAVKAELSANRFLPNVIGTVLGQSYSDWQLLIGVNGTDGAGTFEAASKWTAVDNRIHVISMPSVHDRGSAMNAMIDVSRGDIIAAIDVDDLWHPLKLEKQLPLIDRYSVVGTLGCYFGSRYQDIGVPAGPIDNRTFAAFNPVLHSSVIMPRQKAKWVVSDDRRVPTDYVRWLDMAVQHETFYNVPELLTFIRLHGDRWSDNNINRDIIAKLQEDYAPKLQ